MKLSVLSRYLVKEVAQAWVAVTFVLIAVLMTNRLVRFLADAASGRFPADAVFDLLLLKALSYLAMVLPASFFLGVVLAFGRLYRDSEMAALAACGGGPRELYRALLLLALPLMLLVAWLSMQAGPWGARAGALVQAEAQHAMEFEAIRPGRFITAGRGNAMFYIGSMSEDGARMRDIVIQTERDGQVAFVTADSARQIRDPEDGHRYIILEDGHRHEGVPGGARWQMVEFAEHGVRLSEEPVAGPRLRPDGMTTTELYRRGGAADWAELQWRLSMPLMVLLLAFIAVPLSKAEPREGRYGKLLIAVIVYVLYANLLTVAQEALRDGRVSPVLGLWWVHALVVVAAIVWLRRRYRWPRLRQRQRA